MGCFKNIFTKKNKFRTRRNTAKEIDELIEIAVNLQNRLNHNQWEQEYNQVYQTFESYYPPSPPPVPPRSSSMNWIGELLERTQKAESQIREWKLSFARQEEYW